MRITRRPNPAIAATTRSQLPDRIPQWKGIPLGVSLAQQQYVYAFTPAQEDVELEGEGLGQLYVCFGAPGVGKSYFMLKMLNELKSDRWSLPWGGLLLDPKQTLMKEVQGAIDAERLHVVSPTHGSHTNMLASHLAPRDLGVALALAAQAAGVSAKDPFWLNELKRLFGAGLSLLSLMGKPMTLASLAELLLGASFVDGVRVTTLQGRLTLARTLKLDGGDRRRLERAVSELSQFASATSDNTETVRSFISQVLAPFLDPDLDYVSDAEATDSVADLVLGEGKWVLLAVPRSALSVSRMLAALAKTLFQRAVLERYDLYPGNDRRAFLFVDEYAELASDMPGDGFGDSLFFSQMRQFRVLSVLATQGIPMLDNSGVKDAWKTILSNSAGKIFFRVGDPDTAELAAKLLGEGDTAMTDGGVSVAPDGGSVSRNQKLERRTVLTSDLFVTGLERGHFVYVGTTDGKGAARYQVVRVE